MDESGTGSAPAVARGGATAGEPPTARAVFGGRVAGVFATRVLQFVSGLLLTYVIGRLLGPDGRGVYATLTLIPGTLYALATFGIPSAITFFAGRGRSLRSMFRLAVVFGIAAGAWLIVGTLIFLPALERSVLRIVPPDLVLLILVAIPFQFTSILMGSVLLGRLVIRAYNTILVGQAFATVALVIALAGVLGLGVRGAVLSYTIAQIGGCILVFIQLWRTERSLARPDDRPASAGEVVRYGIKLYPAAITGYFNYRADVYLMNWLLGSSTVTGLYTMAVSLAEITFYIPDSVSSIFFPHVAASDRRDADRTVAMVSRVTLLLTTLGALAIAPASILGLIILLPKFEGSIPALLVLMPAIVALSLSKVLAGYLTGLGRAGPVAVASIAALVLNVALNLILIPLHGPVGAAAASLASYSLHAGLMLAASVRLSRQPWYRFLVPTGDDIGRVYATGLGIARSLLHRRG